MMKKNDMELIGLLQEVLKEKLWKIASGTTITLKEKESGQEVEIPYAPQPVIIMSPESIMSPRICLSILKEKRNLKKSCDYMLIAKFRGKHHAILIELKKTLPSERSSEAQEQLRRSLPLLQYLLSVCCVENEKNIPEPHISYVLIAWRRLWRCVFGIPEPHISYVLIAKKLNKHFNKRHPRAKRSGKLGVEEYKGIKINKFCSTSVSFKSLLTTL